MKKNNNSKNDVRVKPQWKVEGNKLVVLNESELSKEQLAYLKVFMNKKKFTDADKNKLIAAIKANESSSPAPAKVDEEPKVKDEVAATKKKSSKKTKEDKKEKVVADKPKKSKKVSYKEGQVVPMTDNLGVKILADNAKVKVGMIAFIPNYPEVAGDDEAPENVFLEVGLVLHNTVYFIEHETENLLAATKSAANAHFIDDSGELKGADRIPFYLCELADIEKPKEEKKDKKEKHVKVEKASKKKNNKKSA